MNQNLKKSGLALVVASLSVLTLAPAASASTARFSLLGDLNFAKQTISGGGLSASSNSKMGFGGGAMVDLPMSSSVGIGIGALYQMRKVGGDLGTATFPYLEMPVTLGFMAGQHISIDLGGYYALGMGSIKSGDGTSATYANSGYKTSDYGLVGGIRIITKSGLWIGGRYQFGLAELSASPVAGVTTKWTNIQAMLGFRFGGSK